MHPSLSKSELGYGDYTGLQPHSLHHEAMYYQPPVYQVRTIHYTLPASGLPGRSIYTLTRLDIDIHSELGKES